MPTEFDNLYYGISNNGYLLINSNDIDFSNDLIIIYFMKKYKKVVFGDKFNSPVNWLPEGITHLQFGKSFNQSLDNLPGTLKELIIASQEIAWCKFNKPLDNLPIGLEHLTLRIVENYTYPINNLPSTIKTLSFICKDYHHPINNLPEGLEELIIMFFDFINTYHLPSTLKKIDITGKLLELNSKNAINKNLIAKYPNITFTYNG